jgi:outer membrane protein TolC
MTTKTAFTLVESARRRTPAAIGSVAIVAIALGLSAPMASAQTPRVTLEDALRIAVERSEALVASRAGEARAEQGVVRANSQRLPQINFVGSYDRTLASEFSSLLESTGTPCAPLAVDPARPVADRVAELERAASCGGFGTGFNFGNLPFGQRNIYRLSFSFAQNVYTGGRIQAERAQAALGVRAATLATSSARAELDLEVTRAFFDAALGDRLVAIAEAGTVQAEAALAQARLAFEAGRQPEFERLRAEVERDNQRPRVIRAKAARDLAYLRLRQLLEWPASRDLVLDVDLDAASLEIPAAFANAPTLREGTVAIDERAGVQQADAELQVREAGVAVARAARRPVLMLGSSFGEVGYPSSGVFPGAGDFRTNWTLGASVQVPIFTGYRLKADERAAQAGVVEAQARLKQVREIAELDLASARQELEAADAVWRASTGTVQQAQRAYEIAEVRYREGVSTQLELSSSRLSLQVAQANRAQAARDLQVARARLALLPDLPVGAR